jgi:phosphatidylinositol alpha-1,6-mannosyltransferase
MSAARPPRRILLAATGIHVGGGIASVNRCILRALEEEREAARLESVDTLSLIDDPARGEPPAGGVRRYAGNSQLRFTVQLWRSLRQRAPDLVVFDHAGLARAMQLPLPGFSRHPYAIFAHGTELAVIGGGRRRAAFEAAERILTNSEFTARFVRERFRSLAGRVHAVPLCIDPDRIELWEKDLPDAPARREPAVLIVGRLWSSERGKGHDALLAALPRVRERVPDAELWIVGSGDDAPRLESAAREKRLTGAVRFLGGVSDRELGRLYRSAGVFAMPSRQEGFGLVYAEAMWHGLPCIGSTLDAAGEVISDARTGRLVPYDSVEPLADAIAELLSNRGLAERMGSAAAVEARRRFGYGRFRIDLLRALGLARSEHCST